MNVLALDAFGGGDMGGCLTVVAIEGEGDPDLFIVVAADLEAVGAPSNVRTFGSDLTVMEPIIDRFGVAHQQQIVQLHDSVNALGIGPRAPVLPGVAAQDGMDTPIAVGGHVGDNGLDILHQFPIRECGRPLALERRLWHAQRYSTGRHLEFSRRPSFQNSPRKRDRAQHPFFLGPGDFEGFHEDFALHRLLA